MSLVRPLQAADLATAHRLSRALGWPHRLEDWQYLHRIGQGLVLEDDEGVFATGFCFPQGDYATLGLVIVATDRQGQGQGRRLMDHLLALAGPRTPLLVATTRGAPLYRSQGFTGYERIHQHQIAQAATPEAVHPLESGVRLLPATEWPRLTPLANAATGLDRHPVLHNLLAQTTHVAALEAAGELHGFALLRSFGRGLIIGPVVAQDSNQAQALILTLLRKAQGHFLRLDVTASSDLSPWLTALGIPQVDDVEQMAKGTPPTPREGLAQFALATQALG